MDDTPVVSASPRLAVIGAMARNRIIGAGNRMPWHLSPDLRHFRALTIGHRVVMGRKTWESLGRPLAGRDNVVVTRNRSLIAPGCTVVHALEAALLDDVRPPPAFCIGGAELYAQALPLAGEIHLTEIDADFSGDATMPPIPLAEWREDAREWAVDPATGLRYAFVHLTRIAAPARLATAVRAPT
jgi:dihydrofolate reductase